MSTDPFDQNPFDPNLREGLRFLREQHLGGLEADDEQALKLAVEQSRYLIFGGSGVALSALARLSANASSHQTMLIAYAVICALFCIAFGFFSNETAIKLHWRRIDRRFDVLKAFTRHWLEVSANPEASIDLSTAHADRNEAFVYEKRATMCMRCQRACGVVCLAIATITLGATIIVDVAK